MILGVVLDQHSGATMCSLCHSLVVHFEVSDFRRTVVGSCTMLGSCGASYTCRIRAPFKRPMQLNWCTSLVFYGSP